MRKCRTDKDGKSYYSEFLGGNRIYGAPPGHWWYKIVTRGDSEEELRQCPICSQVRLNDDEWWAKHWAEHTVDESHSFSDYFTMNFKSFMYFITYKLKYNKRCITNFAGCWINQKKDKCLQYMF